MWLAVDASVEVALLAIAVTLWLASMAALWKMAMILNNLTNQCNDIKRDAKLAKKQGKINAANIAAIQMRFDIPQSHLLQEEQDLDVDEILG